VTGPSVLIDPARRERRLDELRRRRALLWALRDDIDLAWRSLLPSDINTSWRSAAQRRYLERRRELAGELRRACRELDDAVGAVNAAISESTVSP
jgi:hypothetical protein